MRYTAVSTVTGLPTGHASVTETELEQPVDRSFMYYPRIRCLDCPRKLYATGPGDASVANFEIHLRNKIHIANVHKRIEDADAEEVEEIEVNEQSGAKTAEAPIKFEDAVGRKFSFPFHLCSTWMVSSIKHTTRIL